VTFSAAVEISDFCELQADRQSPERLEFRDDPDRTLRASTLLIKESKTILFSDLDQEISTRFDPRNRLD
jgi:hypothetical protein